MKTELSYITNYSSPPALNEFEKISGADLLANLQEMRESNLDGGPSDSTEWGRHAYEFDNETLLLAVKEFLAGKTIYTASDEDGCFMRNALPAA